MFKTNLPIPNNSNLSFASKSDFENLEISISDIFYRNQSFKA